MDGCLYPNLLIASNYASLKDFLAFKIGPHLFKVFSSLNSNFWLHQNLASLKGISAFNIGTTCLECCFQEVVTSNWLLQIKR